MVDIKRVVCWFSCGVTSAYATKLTLEKYKDVYPIVIAYCDTGSEHLDNKRFLKECENWYKQEILVLQHPDCKTIWEVYDTYRYIAGKYGAKCSVVLKKNVREAFEDLEHDLQIFGYDNAESKRADKFRANNPLVISEFPLIDANISKSDCILHIVNAGIDLPIMYKMGYKNNNCIGCVRGAKGYWNKIRRDFPDIFAKMSEYEHKYNVKLNLTYDKTTKSNVGVFLDELDPKAGKYESELPIVCGFTCGDIE